MKSAFEAMGGTYRQCGDYLIPEIGSGLVNGNGAGIGGGVSLLLTNVELQRFKFIVRHKIPYSGTALSHLASQNVSLRAGFVPTFCELTTKKSER